MKLPIALAALAALFFSDSAQACSITPIARSAKEIRAVGETLEAHLTKLGQHGYSIRKMRTIDEETGRSYSVEIHETITDSCNTFVLGVTLDPTCEVTVRVPDVVLPGCES